MKLNKVGATTESTTEVRRVYYLKGTQPKGMRGDHAFSVKDPPASGHAIGIVTFVPEGKAQIFCPTTLQTFLVPPDCAEVFYSTLIELDKIRLARHIARRYREQSGLGVQASKTQVDRVLEALGGVGKKLQKVG